MVSPDGPKWSAEGKMIGDLIDASGYDRKEFARLLQVSDDVLSNICRGITKLRPPRRQTAASLLGMSDDDLRKQMSDAAGLPPAPQKLPKHDRGPLTTVNVRGKLVVVPQGQVPVPIFGSVPAGNPNHNFSQAEDIEFMPDTGDPDVLYFGTFVDGHSMHPDFSDGDRVIFEVRQPLPNQLVYALKDGEETFKVLRKHNDEWELWPLNDDYEPMSAKGYEIRGVLRRAVRYLRGGPKVTLDYPSTYTVPKNRK